MVGVSEVVVGARRGARAGASYRRSERAASSSECSPSLGGARLDPRRIGARDVCTSPRYRPSSSRLRNSTDSNPHITCRDPVVSVMREDGAPISSLPPDALDR
jgi:hypothetical protein